MTAEASGTPNVHVNLGGSGPSFSLALVALLVGSVLGAWLMYSWASFNVSAAYEERIEVLEVRQAARTDSLTIIVGLLEVADARFRLERAESDQLARDLESATAEAEAARQVADDLYAIADTTTAGLTAEVDALRHALIMSEVQCAVCDESVEGLERGIQELLAIDAVKDRQIFTLNAITVDLQEAVDLAQSELDRAGGSFGGWSAFGGPPVAIVGLAALVLLLSR